VIVPAWWLSRAAFNLRRAQQAADVVGAKRRARTWLKGCLLCVVNCPPRAQPHTERATETTSSSLARWSASLIALPSIIEANPHWGLSASRSSGT